MEAFRELKWHMEYDRKEQIKRLNEHLSSGGGINQFLYMNTAEYTLDNLFRYIDRALKAREEEIRKNEARKNRFKFWKK
jgi:hypothetical protein